MRVGRCRGHDELLPSSWSHFSFGIVANYTSPNSIFLTIVTHRLKHSGCLQPELRRARDMFMLLSPIPHDIRVQTIRTARSGVRLRFFSPQRAAQESDMLVQNEKEEQRGLRSTRTDCNHIAVVTASVVRAPRQSYCCVCDTVFNPRLFSVCLSVFFLSVDLKISNEVSARIENVNVDQCAKN